MQQLNVTHDTCNTTRIGRDAFSYTYAFGMVSILLSVNGTVGSVTCIWHTRRQLQQYKDKSSATQILIISLSLATFFFSTFALPLNSYTMMVGPANYVRSHWAFCMAHTYIYYVLITVCAYSHSSMAINRLLVVTMPRMLTPGRNLGILIFLLTSCWMLPGVMYLFPLLNIGGSFGYSLARNRCAFTVLDPVYHLFCKIMYAFVPLTIIVVCYGWIVLHEILARRRVAHATLTPRKRSSTYGHIRRDLKATKIAWMMSMVFMLCYLPFAVYGVAVQTLDGLDSVVGMGFDLWVWIGCSINPIVYGVLTSLLRRQKRLRPTDGIPEQLACTPFAPVTGGTHTIAADAPS